MWAVPVERTGRSTGGSPLSGTIRLDSLSEAHRALDSLAAVSTFGSDQAVRPCAIADAEQAVKQQAGWRKLARGARGLGGTCHGAGSLTHPLLEAEPTGRPGTGVGYGKSSRNDSEL